MDEINQVLFPLWNLSPQAPGWLVGLARWVSGVLTNVAVLAVFATLARPGPFVIDQVVATVPFHGGGLYDTVMKGVDPPGKHYSAIVDFTPDNSLHLELVEWRVLACW